MRCIIRYRWGLGSSGMHDFGVKNRQDPAIRAVVETIQKFDREITSITFIGKEIQDEPQRQAQPAH